MRDWLSIIIVLLILGILLDGFRRMRAYRKHTLRMSKDLAGEDLNDDVPSSEFPSGGARVIAYRDSSDIDSITRNARQNYEASRQTKGSRNKIPEQVTLNLNTPAPMLMDSLDPSHFDDNSHEEHLSSPESDDIDFNAQDSQTAEPSLGSLDDLDDLAPEFDIRSHKNYADDFETPVTSYQSPITGKLSREEAQVLSNKQKSTPQNTVKKVEQPLKQESVKQSSVTQDSGKQGGVKQDSPKKADGSKDQAQQKAPDLVLVMNVMAKRGEVFSGTDILNAFLDNGLRYGDMDIFHRHESADGKGKILFSVANIVMPGTFDISEMQYFETPGFSMFLSLPIAGDSLGVYELMADTAQALVQELGGELKDEQRSVMTRQTIEHDRQRVIEYERKKRLERA